MRVDDLLLSGGGGDGGEDKDVNEPSTVVLLATEDVRFLLSLPPPDAKRAFADVRSPRQGRGRTAAVAPRTGLSVNGTYGIVLSPALLTDASSGAPAMPEPTTLDGKLLHEKNSAWKSLVITTNRFFLLSQKIATAKEPSS